MKQAIGKFVEREAESRSQPLPVRGVRSCPASAVNLLAKKFRAVSRHNRKVCDRRCQLAARRTWPERKNRIGTKCGDVPHWKEWFRPGADDPESSRAFPSHSKDRPVKRCRLGSVQGCGR